MANSLAATNFLPDIEYIVQNSVSTFLEETLVYSIKKSKNKKAVL